MITSRLWEYRFGAIQIASVLLESIKENRTDDHFVSMKAFLFEQCKELLLDKEFRVRNNSFLIIKHLIRFDGCKVYEDFKETLFKNINDTFLRNLHGTDASGTLKSGMFAR